jgi:hypothetical protein
MTLLHWSPDALAALRNKRHREEITRLFDAYFRVAETKDLTGTLLPLDLPAETRLGFVAPNIPPPLNPARPGMPLRESKRPPLTARSEVGRHHFYARFMKDRGWVVKVRLKLAHQIIAKGGPA